MSAWKQLALSLIILAAAAAGWYAWTNPEAVEPIRTALSSVTPGEQSSPAGAPSAASQASAPRRGPGGPGGAPPVVVAAAELDGGGEKVTALGSAKAGRSVTIVPEVTGIVQKVLFRPGEPVDEGEVLVELDRSTQEIAVERARIALEQAKSALSRAQQLAKSRNISEVALQDAEIAVRVAEIELRTAELEERKRTIRAPFGGVAGLSDVSVGDLVTTSSELATLDDLSRIVISFEVPERFSGRIGRGTAVSGTARALPGEVFGGAVTAVDSRIDPATRTLRMEAEIENRGGRIKPGMAVAIAIALEGEKRVAVPALSVQWDRQGSFVWRLAGEKVERVPVAILSRRSDTVVVKAEVEPEDLLVVEGVQRLRNGAEVAVVRRVAPASSRAAPDEDATAHGSDAPVPASRPAERAPG
ncbi:efflux RND transporter periplasmic adaptor subunit [Faunimonas sp. B44]|uniref:efflux RND transporter periplasmic adaptor subunit n=1 Tax=Faunimonas sp. B44 TaxID=3461493 RepID=UPI004044F618